MQAVRFHTYGDPDVLQLEEVETPRPAAGEVRVRVRASSLNPADIGGRNGKVRLVHARHLPHIPGYDVAGVIDRCGPGVTAFVPGEPVFAMVGLRAGAHAEYACVAEGAVARAPERIALEEAGTVPLAGLTALQGLRRHANLQPGQRLLVNGAAGGVGSFAVQIGKALGCHVTGVGHGETGDLIASLGADEVVDYTHEDITQAPRVWDVVFDAAGTLDLVALRAVLEPDAVVVSPMARPKNVLTTPLRAVGPWPRYRFFITQERGQDLALLARLIDTGKVRPVIDRVFALDDVVAAHRHLEGSRTRGKVALRVGV
jgi:NADPH:quinone reductase-like Zn-dependent oxidoreductase